MFIHGMGEHKPGWHEPALEVLSEAFPKYALLKGKSFADFVKPIPVVYSGFFSELRELWKKDVAAIKATLGTQLEAADTSQRTAINNEIDSIANAAGAGADPFVWTHAMDVVLYRFFKLVRHPVNVKVAKKMLTATAMDSSGWSIIAHSLGTAVTHNALHALYTDPKLIAGQQPLSPTETRPKVLAMVANVSRVLQLPTVKVFMSKVMPGPSQPDRACNTYLNVRHVFDPFMFPQPFEPDSTWPPPGTFVKDQYQHIRPTNIALDRLRDVHDLKNYLINPRVHVPIFRGILGASVIPEPEFEAARDAFDQNVAKKQVDVIRHQLEANLPAKAAEWQALLKSLFDLSGLIKP